MAQYGSITHFNAIESTSSIISPYFLSTGESLLKSITSSSGNFSYAKFGNTTSYSNFEEDGTLNIVGDARTFRDELGDITKLKVSGVGIVDDSTNSTVNISTDANLSDFLYTNVQLNHDRDITEGIYPHIHWMQSSGNSPNLLLAYRWQSNCQYLTSDWTYIKCNKLVCSYTSGTINQISATTSVMAAPLNSTISDIVQFKIFRDVSNISTEFNSTDNYSLPVKMTSFDVHIVANTLGSRTEYSK